MNLSDKEGAICIVSCLSLVLGKNINGEQKSDFNLWKRTVCCRYFDTIRVDNLILAAFEDEYGDSELKRKNGAEKIYQIHCIQQAKVP